VEARQGKLQVVLALLLIGASPAAQEGGAAGTLTLDGVTVKLAHGYASARPGFFDRQTEDVHVLLSDVALSEADRADVFALTRLARDGKATILEVVIDASGAPVSGAIYARHFNGMASMSGMHRFEGGRVTRTQIAGRLFMDAPRSFLSTSFHYDTTFQVPIPRPPSAEERAAALTSPPARAARQYLAAIRTGDLQGFVTTLSAAGAAGYRAADGAAKLKRLAADMPPDTQVVEVKASSSGPVLVVVQGHQDGIVIEYILTMVEEAGGWKVEK
jgi:hypothetical protein